MKTFIPKHTQIKRKWHLIDASSASLGRVATKIASLLSGKGKFIYTPHQDLGDFVVVINANKLKVTGKKLEKKIYYHHTWYPGGIKAIKFKEKFEKDPKWIIWHAVRNMLPANRFRRFRLRRLKIFLTEKHPYQAQIKANSR